MTIEILVGDFKKFLAEYKFTSKNRIKAKMDIWPEHEYINNALKWKDGNDVIKLNIRKLGIKVVNKLQEFAKKKHEQPEYNHVLQHISMFKRICDNPKSAKVGTLKALEEALAEYVRQHCYRYMLGKIQKDGRQTLYVVTGVKYSPAREYNPAHTELKMSYVVEHDVKESNKTWYHGDIHGKGGLTVGELLERAGYFPVTEKTYKEYEKTIRRYMKFSKMIGEQFTTDKVVKTGGGRYDSVWQSISEDGGVVKLVCDEDETKVKSDYITSGLFWSNIDDNEEEEFSDEEVPNLEVPIHPYIRMFNLQSHYHLSIHADNAIEYTYDETMYDKLILPKEIKNLIDVMVGGTTDIMSDIVKGKTGGIIVMASGAPGVGKCHGKGTKILMYDGGTKKVEEIKVNDKLMGDNSEPIKVVSLARGKEEIFKIIPNKGGEEFTINKSHKMVFCVSGKFRGKKTGDIIEMPFYEYLNGGNDLKHRLKLVRTTVNYNENSRISIDPYFFGLWLGCEDWRFPHIHVNEKDDTEIIKYLNALCTKHGLKINIKDTGNSGKDTKNYQLTTIAGKNLYDNNLIKYLDELNVRNKEKLFDIKIIMRLSIADRKKIIAGYIDADGSKAREGVYEISSKRRRMLNHITTICRSVGYRATFSEKVVEWSGNAASKIRKDGKNRVGTKRTYYRLIISGAYDIPVLLFRKKSTEKNPQKNCLVSGFKYKSLGVDEYYGFTLNGNGRYLLADTTITHNTLTAEVYSEYAKRPLYVVQSSQLGVRIDDLEKNLKQVLSRAVKWRAILLIDEADVYVHERGDDLVQNAVVGVFLRVLEYYRGILFMTSNRGTIVDDAIMSRCTAHIRYSMPTTDDLKKIWRILADSFKANISDGEIAKIVEHFPNISGRDVKTMLKLANMVAKRKKEPVTLELMKYVSGFHDITYSKKVEQEGEKKEMKHKEETAVPATN